jgi:hypothetical protein
MFAEAAQYFATTILELGDTGSTQKRRKRTFSDDLSYRSPRSVTISKTGREGDEMQMTSPGTTPPASPVQTTKSK